LQQNMYNLPMSKETEKSITEAEQNAQIFTNGLMIIDHPEIYYIKPTPEQEEKARLDYQKLQNKHPHMIEDYEQRRIPSGIETYYGKCLFLEHDSRFANLAIVFPDIDVYERVYQMREVAIVKLKTLSSLDVTGLKAKAILLQFQKNRVN
jgi:hypothetical protein